MSFLLPINGRSSVSLIFWHKEWAEELSSQHFYFDKTQMSEPILEPRISSSVSDRTQSYQCRYNGVWAEFIIKEAARANVTTLVDNHRSRIKNVTGGSVAEMWVNVGSFVITIIMPGLVSACQGMEESVTPSPGVNSYESRLRVEDENAIVMRLARVSRMRMRAPGHRELLLVSCHKGPGCWMTAPGCLMWRLPRFVGTWHRDITWHHVTHHRPQWLSSVLSIMGWKKPCPLHLNCFNQLQRCQVSADQSFNVYSSNSFELESDGRAVTNWCHAST